MAESSRSIESSVGRNGLNRSADVLVIQKLLNSALTLEPKFNKSGIAKLGEDGSCGPKTISAISKFQETVLGWSGSAVDGTVNPNKQTWKALNGNVASNSEIKPLPTTGAAWVGNYAAFRQGDYKEKLGDSTSATIAGYGCAMCTLTMAATSIGAPTKHWPADLRPRDLTPLKSNEILRKAGAFSGYSLTMSKAAEALGMGYDEYGRYADLTDAELVLLDFHLQYGYPVAAHVDYKSGSAGDHWILVIKRNGDGTYNSIDPATGRTLLLTDSRNMTVDNKRYATTKDEKKGVLFGYGSSGGSKNQQNYIVVRFALLNPSSGGMCS